MKATELMIGDWVQVPSELNRYKMLRSTFDMDEAILYEPIPLTTEILEKNGWYHDKFHGSYGRQAMRIDGCYQDELPKGVDNALSFAQWSIDKKFMYHFLEIFMWVGSVHLKIEYVHELQHALRLCGIEKEIKL